jgi:hypothetical protein
VAPARIQQSHRAVGAPRDDDAAIGARGHVGDARARRVAGRRRRIIAGAGPAADDDGVRRDDLHVAMEIQAVDVLAEVVVLLLRRSRGGGGGGGGGGGAGGW